MLAYVFWHRPRPDATAETYEALLREFHRALGAAPPPGLTASAAFRMSSVPWAPGEPVYEDWYLVRDSAALDPLNLAAISGSRRQAHDAAAAQAGWGAAGLYRLRDGQPMLARARGALWLNKPPATSYDAFYRRVRDAAGPGPWTLWGRQMVLGPTPEFCVHATDPAGDLASEAQLSVGLEPIWPDPTDT